MRELTRSEWRVVNGIRIVLAAVLVLVLVSMFLATRGAPLFDAGTVAVPVVVLGALLEGYLLIGRIRNQMRSPKEIARERRERRAEDEE